MLSTDLLTHYRQLSQQSFTVIDLETTGPKHQRNRAIEIALLQANLKDGIQHQQSTLINPEVPIPLVITEITGISPYMLVDAPRSPDVWMEYLPLLSQGVLTAHNLRFDYRFVQMEYRRLRLLFDRPPTEQLCTVVLARLLLPELPSRSLPDLVQHFELPIDRFHRAESDTLACWLVAERLFAQLLNEEDEVLLGKFARQWMMLKEIRKLWGCSEKTARRLLMEAEIEPRKMLSSGIYMYERGPVEQVYWQLQQLSTPIEADPLAGEDEDEED